MARRSGRRASGAIRPSPPPTCSGGTTWARAHDIGVTPRPIYKADGRKLPDCYTKPSELRDELRASSAPFRCSSFWGPGDLDRRVALDRRCRPARAAHARADADARLPAASRLRPAALRARRSAHRQEPRRDRRGRRRSDRRCRARRRARDRALRIRHHAGLDADPCQSRAARSRPAGVRRRGRRRATRRAAVATPSRSPTTRSRTSMSPSPACRRGAAHRRGACRASSTCSIAASSAPSGSITRTRASSSPSRGPTPGSPIITGSTTVRAPDFARLVEIHRKPGYDPVELFLDPAIRSPKLAVGWRLARRALGFRTLMDVIPLDASLVKGSHGRLVDDDAGRSGVHLERAAAAARQGRSPQPR